MVSECRPCVLDLRILQAEERASLRWSLLISRDFGLVWWSQVASQVGDGITRLALLWFVYAMTGSPLKTTVIALLQTIPPILLGPFIGVYLDRLPKKPILIGVDLFRAVLLGIVPCWVGVEAFTVEWLYVVVFLHAVAGAAFGPALTASIPLLIRQSDYTAGNALLQMASSLGAIFGSLLSGIGIATFTSQQVLCVNAATYVLSAVCLLPVSLSNCRARSDDVSSPIFHDLIEGLRFAFIRQQTIFLVIVMAAIFSFGTSAFSTLFPVIGHKVLDLGPVEVGYLWAAFSVGLFLASLLLLRLTHWTLRQRLLGIAAASAISGMALAGFLWVPDRLVAGLLMGIIGGGTGLFTPIAWGVLQELSPDRLVGRTLSLYGTGAMTAAVSGMTAFGWVTQAFGERASVIGIALMMFITAVVALGFGHALRPWLTTSLCFELKGTTIAVEPSWLPRVQTAK